MPDRVSGTNRDSFRIAVTFPYTNSMDKMLEMNPLRQRKDYCCRVMCCILMLLCAAPLCAQDATMNGISKVGGYVKTQGSSRVIVFLHGIYSGKEAWRCDEGHYWPAMIAADKDAVFADTDIYVAVYDAPKQDNKMDLLDIQTQVVNRLDADSVFSSHREVIFVAHSMGGILIQEILLTYSDEKYIDKVHHLFLYGTPLEGSKWASIGKLFKSDPHLKELQSGDNFVLSDLDQRWLHKGSEIKRYCSYEVEKEGIAKVVSRQSATRGCSDTNAIKGNHRDIVKPCSNTDDAYTYLKRKLRGIQDSSPLKGKATNDPPTLAGVPPASEARTRLNAYEQTGSALKAVQQLARTWNEEIHEIDVDRVFPYKHGGVTGPISPRLPEDLAERVRMQDESFSRQLYLLKPFLVDARKLALRCMNLTPNDINADSAEFDAANAVAVKRMSLFEIENFRVGQARSSQLEQYFSSLHQKVGAYHCNATD